MYLPKHRIIPSAYRLYRKNYYATLSISYTSKNSSLKGIIIKTVFFFIVEISFSKVFYLYVTMIKYDNSSQRPKKGYFCIAKVMVIPMKLKLTTFNISHCQDYSLTHADDSPVSIEATASYIRTLDGDITALNEVFLQSQTEEYDRQTEKINAIAGYPYTVDAVGKNLPWASIGNAILSRYPLSDVRAVAVPAPTEEERRPDETEWYEDRVILCARAKTEAGFVLVMTTHFGLNGQEHERMVRALTTLIDDADIPIILMGDFNVQPHAAVLQPIYDRLRSCADVTGNTDATFSSFAPDRTIDYIFVSDGIVVEEFTVRTEIVSDHRACTAVIAL